MKKTCYLTYLHIQQGVCNLMSTAHKYCHVKIRDRPIYRFTDIFPDI